jgi:osmotically-inducible protein OsmY
MMSSLDYVLFTVCIAASVSLLFVLPKQGKVGVIAAAFLAVTLTGFTQPALAAAVDDNVLTEGQKALNENLKTTPQGNQYQGIEYPQTKGTPLSDQQITEKIKDEIPEGIKLSVASGSVRVSGKVSDRRTAQEIVQDIKEIPGVQEVSYDLGLAS